MTRPVWGSDCGLVIDNEAMATEPYRAIYSIITPRSREAPGPKGWRSIHRERTVSGEFSRQVSVYGIQSQPALRSPMNGRTGHIPDRPLRVIASWASRHPRRLELERHEMI